MLAGRQLPVLAATDPPGISSHASPPSNFVWSCTSALFHPCISSRCKRIHMVLEWAQTKTDRGMGKGKRKNEDFVELQQCEDEDGCA